jgi:hypothetical protein
MSQTVLKKIRIFSGAGLVAIASLSVGINSATAQQAIPNCQPPSTGEYLLLVVSPTRDSQNQLRRALPTNVNTTLCKYLNDTVVTRIGGFTKLEDANGWARYVKDIVGLSAFVTSKPGEQQVIQASTASPTATAPPSSASYNPRQLGEGYAVLVDYFNRPELATQVQQAVGGNVGFVAYGGRHYLLAVFTTNQREANSTLQALSERGFFAMLVDSRNVTLLRSSVNSQ